MGVDYGVDPVLDPLPLMRGDDGDQLLAILDMGDILGAEILDKAYDASSAVIRRWRERQIVRAHRQQVFMMWNAAAAKTDRLDRSGVHDDLPAPRLHLTGEEIDRWIPDELGNKAVRWVMMISSGVPI